MYINKDGTFGFDTLSLASLIKCDLCSCIQILVSYDKMADKRFVLNQPRVAVLLKYM